MRDAPRLLLSIIRIWLGTRAELQLEILALRHQLTVLQRQAEQAAAAHFLRPDTLGLALPSVAQLPGRPRRREA
jgi:hypothetical protein